MQAETQTKMSIVGRGSMRDRKKEEELRNSDDPTHDHLKDDLHVLIQAEPPYSDSKLAAGVAEVKKMLIPLVSWSYSMIVATVSVSVVGTMMIMKLHFPTTFEVMRTIFKSLSTFMCCLYYKYLYS